MPSQTFGQIKSRQIAYQVLAAAITRAGLPIYAIPDGVTVRIAEDRCYEPDALVAALPQPSANSLEIANPVIVVEVLSPSPSSARRDLTTKVAGYALVASIQHYLVIDPGERLVFHYRRVGRLLAAPETPAEGVLGLDPPGLEVAVSDLLGPEPLAE